MINELVEGENWPVEDQKKPPKSSRSHLETEASKSNKMYNNEEEVEEVTNIDSYQQGSREGVLQLYVFLLCIFVNHIFVF